MIYLPTTCKNCPHREFNENWCIISDSDCFKKRCEAEESLLIALNDLECLRMRLALGELKMSDDTLISFKKAIEIIQAQYEL